MFCCCRGLRPLRPPLSEGPPGALRGLSEGPPGALRGPLAGGHIRRRFGPAKRNTTKRVDCPIVGTNRPIPAIEGLKVNPRTVPRHRPHQRGKRGRPLARREAQKSDFAGCGARTHDLEIMRLTRCQLRQSRSCCRSTGENPEKHRSEADFVRWLRSTHGEWQLDVIRRQTWCIYTVCWLGPARQPSGSISSPKQFQQRRPEQAGNTPPSASKTAAARVLVP
jgi:hypothetical protein